MKTIGQHLQDVRKIRKKSLQDLANETKIKKSFIVSIEKEEWNKLPEFPVVLGFIKSISNNLDINTPNVVALLKRDYPPQKLNVNPTPEMKEEFTWGPRLTFLLGISVVILVMISYLAYQYFNFLSPPELVIDFPNDNYLITKDLLEVRGKTDPDTTIIVNDQPAFVDKEGNFYTELEVSKDLSIIEVVARARSERETRKSVNVEVATQEEL